MTHLVLLTKLTLIQFDIINFINYMLKKMSATKKIFRGAHFFNKSCM